MALVRAAENFFVESLEAWRVANNITKFVLAGHSMGGYVAVAYAERYPNNVEKLVLISPVGVPAYTTDEQSKRQQRRQGMSSTARVLFNVFETLYTSGYTPGSLFRSLPESTVYKFAKTYIERRLPLVTEQDEQIALTDYLLYNSILPGSGEYCLDLLLNESIHAHDPLVNRINKLEQISNVGFIYGEHDWMEPSAAVQLVEEQQRKLKQEQQQEQQASCGPQMDVYIVSDSGHLLMLENWKEFNNAFLQLTVPEYTIPIGTTQATKVTSYSELASVRKTPNFNNNQQQQQTQQQESPLPVQVQDQQQRGQQQLQQQQAPSIE
jgi:cardiolipin-specific phospholipase